MRTDDETIVVAVVVTFNRRDALARTLAGVFSQNRKPDSVIVVDNNSGDGTQVMLRQRFHDAMCLPMSENQGFAAGLAAGMARATDLGADFCWLLDDDSVPKPQALARLLTVAGSAPDAGIVGLDGAMLFWGVPDERPARLRPVETDGDSELFDCDYVLVDGALVRRSVIDDIGYPRQDFFMMLEDLEYTSRAVRSGWSVLVLKEDLIHRRHLGSGGAQMNGSAPPWRGYYQARNHVAIALEHRSPLEFAGAIYRQLRFIAATAVRGRDNRWLRSRLRCRGMWHGLRGRMGKTLDPDEWASHA